MLDTEAEGAVEDWPEPYMSIQNGIVRQYFPNQKVYSQLFQVTECLRMLTVDEQMQDTLQRISKAAASPAVLLS